MDKRNAIKYKGSKNHLDKVKFFINIIAKYCDKCGTPYKTNDVRIITEGKTKSIIHFSCSNCKSTHIAQFVAPIGAISRTPVNTDLKLREIVTFLGKSKISVNEVLEVYDTLKDKKGTVRVVF